jgi:hypothetical protein
VRQLIKRILKEERKKDLSSKIKKLLQDSVVPNHKMICTVDVVAPEKMYEDPTNRDYQVMVSVIGGLGSKHWPMTQFVIGSRDKIVNDVWHTVYNYMGLNTDVFLRNVKSCDEVMSESTIPNTLKRRANQQTLKKYITNGEINYPTLCDDFEDAYEYTDTVIDYAINELLEEFDEDIYEEDYYSDVMDYLRKLCRDEFGKYLIDIYEMTCPEEDINESKITESSNEKLERLIGNYITMSYPTAQKIRLAPPGVNGSITTFTLPNPEDERDNLIFKFDVFGKPEYNINPEFFNSINSMFGTKRNIKKIILKWFEDKEVDVDLIQDSKKEEPIEEGLHDTSWENDEGDKVTLIDLLDATEDIPVKNIPVDKIKSKLLTWDDDDKEVAKIEKSDLQYPILIFVDDDNKFISIIDGHHRAQKAVKHKLKTIKAKLIPINSLPKNIKKVFSHLKKKGESLNESKMMDYLQQFLSGDVLDSYRKEKGRKEFQKMADMVYKITAKDNPIEGMVGVLVGNIKKEMWGQTYTDPNSVGSRWNFTVVLKPLFTNYNPNNEPDYGERVLNFEKEFSKNIRGMGFEVMSPIQHEKVKNYKVKYEWASRLDVTPID